MSRRNRSKNSSRSRKSTRAAANDQPTLTIVPASETPLVLDIPSDLLQQLNTVQITCKYCRFHFSYSSPFQGMAARGGEVFESSETVACPICFRTTVLDHHFQAVAASGHTIVTLTPAVLALYLQAIADRVRSGEMAPEQVADALAATPWFARVGAWLQKNGANAALTVAVLALLLQAFDVVSSATAPQTVTPDQVQEIISGVLEQLRDEETAPPVDVHSDGTTPASTTR